MQNGMKASLPEYIMKIQIYPLNEGYGLSVEVPYELVSGRFALRRTLDSRSSEIVSRWLTSQIKSFGVIRAYEEKLLDKLESHAVKLFDAFSR